MGFLLYALTLGALLVSISAERYEIIVPKVLYTRRTYCAGETVKISCELDGDAFRGYQLTALTVVSFHTSISDTRTCKANSHQILDLARDSYCLKNYTTTADSLKTYNMLGGVIISSFCTDKVSCNLGLPAILNQTGKSAGCVSKTNLYAMEVSFQCSDPSALLDTPPHLSGKARTIFKRDVGYQHQSEDRSGQYGAASHKPTSYGVGNSQKHVTSDQYAPQNLHHSSYKKSNEQISNQKLQKYQQDSHQDSSSFQDRGYDRSNDYSKSKNNYKQGMGVVRNIVRGQYYGNSSDRLNQSIATIFLSVVTMMFF